MILFSNSTTAKDTMATTPTQHRFILPSPPALKLAASACLLGQKVRYDGNHKLSHLLAELPVQWHPICPEVAIGMGVPRPPIEQRYIGQTLRVVEVNHWEKRYQQQLTELAQTTAIYCQQQGIGGYVLTAKSPSCALHSAKRYHENGRYSDNEKGYFVAQLQQLLPLLPLIEENDLHQSEKRQRFLQQARFFTYFQRLILLPSPQPLLQFHRAYFQRYPTSSDLGAIEQYLQLTQPLLNTYATKVLAIL